MSWKNNLRPASFRGVPFHVAGHDAEAAGRRVQVHEYPGRDRPWPEDLGRKASEFNVEAYVTGDDYMAARDRLISACAEAGPGTLIHPYLGSLSVLCTGCRVAERAGDGRMASFRLSFVDAGENRFPAASADTGANVRAAANRTDAAIQAAFARRSRPASLPSFVAEAAEALVRHGAEAVRAAAGGLTGRMAEAVIREAQALVRAPEDLARRMTKLAGRAARDAGAAAIERLVNYGADLPAVPLTTAPRRLQAARQQAWVHYFRSTAAIALARAALDTAPPDRPAALALRERIGAILDDAIGAASEAGDDDSFEALSDLRAAVVRHIGALAPTLAGVTTHVPTFTEPALVAAYRLYGDASRAGEIAARNRIVHPGFVPASEPLEVLTDA